MEKYTKYLDELVLVMEIYVGQRCACGGIISLIAIFLNTFSSSLSFFFVKNGGTCERCRKNWDIENCAAKHCNHLEKLIKSID